MTEQLGHSPFADESRNSQRRTTRYRPAEELAIARKRQQESGVRIRLSRPVKNHKDFSPELKVWHEPVQFGYATRKGLGALAVTLFDTNQQPLRSSDGHSQASLLELLQEWYPAFFQDTPPITVTGTAPFGSSSKPFIGLTLGPGFLYDEQTRIRSLVAPELSIDDSHQLQHRLHVSLGQVFVAAQAQAIEEQLRPVVPGYVQFGPGQIILDIIEQGGASRAS